MTIKHLTEKEFITFLKNYDHGKKFHYISQLSHSNSSFTYLILNSGSTDFLKLSCLERVPVHCLICYRKCIFFACLESTCRK